MIRPRKLTRVLFSIALLGAALFVFGQGCQDATQATLEIKLDPRAKCAEIPTGTAITVGIEPSDVEARVLSGFVNAKTTDCEDGSGMIGTLVITPNEQNRSSVIVVVGYKGQDPAACKPPKFDGCIVARRRFSFIEHTPLRLPITIDPDCANVPCDAFSTCNKGLCFNSETACDDNGNCEKPGELPDGGLDEGSVITFDSGPDGNTGPNPPFCEASSHQLVCNAASGACGAPNGACCASGAGTTAPGAGGATCAASCANSNDQLCCTDQALGPPECAVNFRCSRKSSLPGKCEPVATTSAPTCNGTQVVCGGASCGSNACCSTSPNACSAGTTCGQPTDEFCCTPNGSTVGCQAGYRCKRLDAAPGKCELIPLFEPTCNVGVVSCGGVACGGNACCTTTPNACSGGSSCPQPDQEYCCGATGSTAECDATYQCFRNGPKPGTCGKIPTTPPTCSGNEVVCGGVNCGGTACCTSNVNACQGVATCNEPEQQLCCSPNNSTIGCPANYRCHRNNAIDPGTCEQIPAPTCVGSEVACGGTTCSSASVCCTTNTNACSGAPMCAQPNEQLCCSSNGSPVGCPINYHCNRGGLAPGICEINTSPTCNGSNVLECGGQVCGGADVCCATNPNVCNIGQMSCAVPTDELCCMNGSTVECQSGFRCDRPTPDPGKCVFDPSDASLIDAPPDGLVPLDDAGCAALMGNEPLDAALDACP